MKQILYRDNYSISAINEYLETHESITIKEFFDLKVDHWDRICALLPGDNFDFSYSKLRLLLIYCFIDLIKQPKISNKDKLVLGSYIRAYELRDADVILSISDNPLFDDFYRFIYKNIKINSYFIALFRNLSDVYESIGKDFDKVLLNLITRITNDNQTNQQ